MALREFYAEKFAEAAMVEGKDLVDTVTVSDAPRSPSFSELELSRRRRAVGVRAEDRWTLEHINLLRIQPLLEAFDDDASTWVTVAEVNTFTQSRPRDWRCVSTNYDTEVNIHTSIACPIGWPIGP